MDQEQALWREYRSERSDAARNRLVEFYLPHVRRIAERRWRKIPTGVVDVDELVAEGTMAVMQSLDRFDAGRGTRPSTFLSWRVNGAITDYLRHLDHVPRLDRQRLKAGEIDGVAELISLETVTAESSEGRTRTLADLLEDRSIHPFADRQAADEFYRELLRGCNRTERLIVLLYYREGLTMKEAAEHVGLSESRVSQLHSRLIERFRDAGRAAPPTPAKRKTPAKRRPPVAVPKPRIWKEPAVESEPHPAPQPSREISVFSLIRNLTVQDVGKRIDELKTRINDALEELRFLEGLQALLRGQADSTGKEAGDPPAKPKSTSPEKIAGYLRKHGSAGPHEISRATGLTHATVGNHLRNNGMFRRVKRGVYELADSSGDAA